MRAIKDSDYSIQVPRKGAPTLADIIEGYCYGVQSPEETDFKMALLVAQSVELIDYLTERLACSDSARVS